MRYRYLPSLQPKSPYVLEPVFDSNMYLTLKAHVFVSAIYYLNFTNALIIE